MKTISLTAVATAVAMLAGVPAFAADHEIKMLNRGADGTMMVFEPAYLEIAPGDTVTFVATDKSHNAETIAGMLPEGAEPFVGKMNQDVSYTFEEDGVYGIKCKPHYAMGMVALIKVGDPDNVAEAEAVSHPGKAKTVFQDLFAELAE
ncbi:pseudoazurin [Citreimonas salinaria]|uniref:Pseudoazurin n=1 Tax=Citreimonas salinaria TaxID=321339 RepID=A0A1H3M3F2_9RHOB|nr:pseudoazurin [Citreimonas salinaria]SDY71262.1 pseudoazurin [Citreimonas salinaria]